MINNNTEGALDLRELFKLSCKGTRVGPSNPNTRTNKQTSIKKAFCFKNCSYVPLIIQINCSSYLKTFANFGIQPQISNIFLINTTIFSHSRSEQFWKQNTSKSNSDVECRLIVCCWVKSHQNNCTNIHTHTPLP